MNHPPVPRSQYIADSAPKDKAGVDEVGTVSPTHVIGRKVANGSMQIFMISLERRPERRNRMLACLDTLRLNFTLFDAVDGRY